MGLRYFVAICRRWMMQSIHKIRFFGSRIYVYVHIYMYSYVVLFVGIFLWWIKLVTSWFFSWLGLFCIMQCFLFGLCVSSLTHCNAPQYTATHCNTLQHIAIHCNTLQHTATTYGRETATCCNTLQQSIREHSSIAQHSRTRRSPLQHTATHCNTLQHVAMQCNNV